VLLPEPRGSGLSAAGRPAGGRTGRRPEARPNRRCPWGGHAATAVGAQAGYKLLWVLLWSTILVGVRAGEGGGGRLDRAPRGFGRPRRWAGGGRSIGGVGTPKQNTGPAACQTAASMRPQTAAAAAAKPSPLCAPNGFKP
jgi:hypothetical protein